ncbi:MAG: SpoVR family protein [Planctomycetes bacterium]|nr:SpoVR family protein [Planctomycetota bacterium]
MSLTPELEAARKEIEGYAREYGLDCFETIFELLDADELNEVAAFGGFPTRYPHWRFGMEYNQLDKGYSYGLSKIYELVINNDPCYAYLMRSNMMVDQKLVMAHVFGHCDFFKNNLWFAKTDRKMMDRMANHGTVVRRLMDRVGLEPVERFLDCCLSLDNLIDPHSMFIRRRTEPTDAEPSAAEEAPVKFRAKGYMDSFINPREATDRERARIRKEAVQDAKLPPVPVRDVLSFLLEYAPLKRWQQEVLELVREEAYYFAPQAMTKIMNEGWASYWHSTMMTQRILRPSEVVDYADHHSGTLATRPGRLNPYKLGIELFRDIEDRWNRGKFGAQWEEMDDHEQKRRVNKKLGLGRDKIFEVRRTHNDVTFVDTFIHEEFAQAQKMFVYGVDRRTGQYQILDRDWTKVKEQMLFSLTNWGQPYIYVTDGNYEKRGELYLFHKWGGVDLQFDFAQATLKNLCWIWDRPVHLETMLENKAVLLTCKNADAEITQRELTPSEEPRGIGAG